MIADLSVNYVERQALLRGYSVERVIHDYGYDLLLFTYDSDGAVEPGVVYVQVKATDDLRILGRRQAVSYRIELADLRLWLGEDLPVILIVYDAQADTAYWLDIQAAILSKGSKNLFRAKGTRTVHLPLANRLDLAAVRRIAELKNNILRQVRGRSDHAD